MKPQEYKKVFHPQMGKFVYVHKGSGVMIDSIFKPFRKVIGKCC